MNRIKELKNKLKSAIILSFAISFMLCIYAPYELFLTNQSEFWFGADIMLLPSILFFVCTFVLCFAVLCVLRRLGVTAYITGLALGLAVLVFSYIQGNFLVSGLPALDGTNFDWSAPSPERVKSIAILLVCICAAVFLFIKFRQNFFKCGERTQSIFIFINPV